MMGCCATLILVTAITPAVTTDEDPGPSPPPEPTSPHRASRSDSMGAPLSLSYFGPYVIQPGVAIGTRLGIRDWTRTRPGRRRAITTTGSLFAGPKLAFFARPGNHLNTWAEAELGYQIRRHRRNVYSAFSVGVAHLASFQVVSIAVDLGDGTAAGRREARHFVAPTLSYTLGQHFHDRVGWLLELSYGHRLSARREGAGLFIVELGLTFQLAPRREGDR